MNLLTRLGLAVTRPRTALAIAGDREHAGRSGSDLLLAILVLVLVTQARPLISAAWLGFAVEPTLGLRAAVQSLTDALAVDLGFLVIGALVIWVASGPRRDLGRASDFACVAVLPLVYIDLVGTVAVLAAQIALTPGLHWALSIGAYAWTGTLIALAAIEARRTSREPLPERTLAVGRKAGWGVVAVVLVGVVVQTVWVVKYLDRMRPVMAGDPAPTFALPRIGANGALGDKVALADQRGKVVVIDFWATWCQPCVKALPHLQTFQNKHPDAAVLMINIDDPAEARALFDESGYTLTLLAGDADVSDRYDVGAIPHTVVIDRLGVVRRVQRGGRIDLEREISPL